MENLITHAQTYDFVIVALLIVLGMLFVVVFTLIRRIAVREESLRTFKMEHYEQLAGIDDALYGRSIEDKQGGDRTVLGGRVLAILSLRRNKLAQWQVRMYRWMVEVFGDTPENVSLEHRGLRLLEEAVEVGQAAGLTKADMMRVMNHVFSKPKGELGQELGGLCVTMLCLAETAHLNLDRVLKTECERVLTLPLDHWKQRNESKNAAGLRVMKPKERRHEVVHEEVLGKQQ